MAQPNWAQQPTTPPPTPPPPYVPPAATGRRPFWTSPRGIVVIVGGFAVIGFLVLLGLNPSADETFKVTITSCAVSGGSLPQGTVGLEVTNNSGTARTARIDVEYRDGSGRRLDTDTAVVRDIGPGDTARATEHTLLDAGADTGATCWVVGIS